MPVDPLPSGTLLCAGPAKRYRYKLSEQPTYRSGYNIVYFANDRRLNNAAWLKELAFDETSYREVGSGVLVQRQRDEVTLHRRMTDSFERESFKLGRVRSPHVVRLLDFWLERGTAYQALEVIEGGQPLYQWQPPEAARWDAVQPLAIQLLQGLDAIHRVGLIQGDLSPSTIAIRGGDQVIITDVASLRADPGVAGAVGSLPWGSGFAPLELEYEHHVSEAGPWSDLYMWALVVHGLMLGHPSPDGLPVAASDRKQSDPYAGAAENLRAAGVPQTWCEVLAQALTVDANQRPRAARDLVDRLVEKPAVDVNWQEVAEETQVRVDQTQALALDAQHQVESSGAELTLVRANYAELDIRYQKLSKLAFFLAIGCLMAMLGIALMLVLG